MRIWVYASGEPLPAADRQVRLLRAGNLCRHLQAAGHEVVWWTSSFDHIRKRQLGEPELANAGLAFHKAQYDLLTDRILPRFEDIFARCDDAAKKRYKRMIQRDRGLAASSMAKLQSPLFTLQSP